jgi:hypothetical protein
MSGDDGDNDDDDDEEEEKGRGVLLRENRAWFVNIFIFRTVCTLIFILQLDNYCTDGKPCKHDFRVRRYRGWRRRTILY